MRRYAKHRDANERQVIEALEAAGAKVLPLNFDTREGVPDLLVSKADLLLLIEVKAPLGPQGGKSHRSLTDAQEKFHAKWSPHCCVVRSPEEALMAIGVIRRSELAAVS